MIRSKKIGPIKLKFEATSQLASDAIEQVLRVTPESHLHKKTEVQLFSGTFTTKYDIFLRIPRDIDEGSARIEFKLDPGVAGLANNTDISIQKPTTNRQQDVWIFSQNIIIFEYHSEMEDLTESDRITMINYLQSGYRNLLTFKLSDGSFNIWKKENTKGSTFSTAMATISLLKAAKYIKVDQRTVNAAFQWLASIQKPDGRFEEETGTSDLHMQGALLPTKYALTSYVLMAFGENQEIARNYRTVVGKIVQYLVSDVHNMTDVYDLSMATYGLSLIKDSNRQHFLETTLMKSISDPNTSERYWNRPPVDVEVAGYALLSLIANDDLGGALPIARWLMKQLNGSSSSTVGVNALAKFAARYSSKRNDYRVEILSGHNRETIQKINVQKSTSMVQMEIPSTNRILLVEMGGNGTGWFQVEYQYKLNMLNGKTAFDLNVQLLNTSTYDMQHLEVCLVKIHRKRQHSRSRNGVSKSTKSVYEDPANNSSSVVKLNSQNKTNWMDLEDIVLKPSCLNTIVALLKLRITILFRDIQRLYLLIILPLAFTALGLYLNSIQVISPVMRSILLDNTTYGSNITKIAVHDNTNRLFSQHNLYHHHQLLQQQQQPSPSPLLLHQKHHQHQHNTQQQSKEASYLYHHFIAELKQSSNVTEDYSGNFSLLLDIAPHMAAFNINSISSTNVSITTLYNDTTQHSLPIILNLISNSLMRIFVELNQQSIYRHQRVNYIEERPAEDPFDSTSSITPPSTASPESILNIELRSHPFQQTTQPQEFNIGTFSSALFVGMIFVLIPVSLAVDMVYDREMKARNQLRVNGLSSALYLSAYFIVLSVLMLLICAALLGLVYLFDIPSFRQPPALITLGLLVFLYSPAGILCSTCFSYFFDRTDSAQSILPNILTFVGLIPFILVVFLDMLGIEVKAAFALHFVFSLINPMYIPYAAVYFVDRVYIACQLSSACAELSMAHYMTEEMIVMACGCLLHIPIWAFCLRVSDVMKSGGRVRDLFHRTASEEDVMTEDQCIGEHEDEDVRNERSKVFRLTTQDQTGQIQPVVVVKSLRKEFSQESLCGNCCCCADDEPPRKKVSVRSLSFAVDAGEVLGLLGHNGAGKTTTMKIMTGETVPTRGTVRVAGHSITINQDDAFKTLGYCPQHDALWKNITVREHLELYARIRGVSRKDMNRLITTYLKGLHISEHANKQTQHCSGGTRRKLSYAMAMVGSPKVVLLDEPSTGMDPKSKRFLWDTILASFHGKRCAMLTTHSMEEADALCSRVGIMVKGELRCLGSTQHLKNLYGAGYTLEIKLKHIESVYSETPIESQPSSSQEQLQLDQSSVDHVGPVPVISNCIDNRSMALRNFVTDLFPSATLEESFADRLVYSVPQQAVSSLAECFSRLEKAKTELDIEEYSFSQTTLEQVFLKFAHYDEETSNVQ